MAYLMSVATIATGEGDLNAVIAEDEGLVASVGFGPTMSEAVDDVVRQIGRAKVSFHPSLVRDAKRLRGPVVVPTAEQKAMRAVMSVAFDHGPDVRPPKAHGLMEAFLSAICKLWVAAPWRFWTADAPLELKITGRGKSWTAASILGNSGQESGFGLYPDGGFDALVEGKLPAQVLSLFLSGGEDPHPGADAIEDAIGVRCFPIIVKARRGKPVPAKDEDLLLLTAVAEAMARLSPDELESHFELQLEGAKVSVTASAPPANATPESEFFGRINAAMERRFGASWMNTTDRLFAELGGDEESDTLFLPWCLFHHRYDGKTAAEWLLNDEGTALDAEALSWLDAQLAARWSVWQIVHSDARGGTILAHDVLRTGERKTHLIAVDVLLRGDEAGLYLLGRVVDWKGRLELSGSHPTWLPAREAEPFGRIVNEQLALRTPDFLSSPNLQLELMRAWYTF